MTEIPSVEPGVIEVWADLVCPWCYIGKRRLQLAMEQTGVDAPVVHRAFQLDPAARTEGLSTNDMLMRKYRVSAEQAQEMQANVTEVARSVGLEYHLELTQAGNTRDAHRLVLWAQAQGLGDALLDRLYRAYFTEGLPVFTPEQLLPLAAEAGLDPVAAAAFLAGDGFGAEVAQDQELAGAFGANGVPFFVLDRRLGISGAQPDEVFQRALEQLAAGS